MSLHLRRLAAGLLLCILLAGCGASDAHPRRPCLFLLPDGYRGWVRIQYDSPGHPPLPARNGYRVFAIGPDGLLRTSSAMEYGYVGSGPDGRGGDQYRYVPSDRSLAMTGWGGGGAIWAGANGRGGREQKEFQYFFVGPESLYHAMAGQAPAPGTDGELH